MRETQERGEGGHVKEKKGIVEKKDDTAWDYRKRRGRRGFTQNVVWNGLTGEKTGSDGFEKVHQQLREHVDEQCVMLRTAKVLSAEKSR